MSSEPAEELARELRDLQRRVDKLHSRVRLADVQDSAEDVGTIASGLLQRIQAVRARGYVFESSLEERARDLESQWPRLRESVLKQIEQEAAALGRELPAVESLLRQVEARADRPSDAEPVLERADRATEVLEKKARAAADHISGMYDQFEDEVNELTGHLHQVEWMLTELAQASFQLLPVEAPIMAVRATWDQSQNQRPQGLLYLTDQRLLFEQKQEIATKKVLFITTEKEKVQQLLFEVPVGQVEKVVASHKGLLGHEDHLDLTFASDASRPTAHFHIDGQRSETWQELIGRATSGDFDRDRAVPLDEEVIETVRSAPTRCPACNAPITQRILRGMDRITCEYCGHIIRL
jgi:hypothetical protein